MIIMKRNLISVCSVLIFIYSTAGFSVSHAIEVGPAELEFQPYAKAGTIAWDQNAGVGGHKFVLAGGLNTNITFDAFEGIINLERWAVSEGLDDDEGSTITCDSCSTKLKVVTDGEYLRTVEAEQAA